MRRMEQMLHRCRPQKMMSFLYPLKMLFRNVPVLFCFVFIRMCLSFLSFFDGPFSCFFFMMSMLFYSLHNTKFYLLFFQKSVKNHNML